MVDPGKVSAWLDAGRAVMTFGKEVVGSIRNAIAQRRARKRRERAIKEAQKAANDAVRAAGKAQRMKRQGRTSPHDKQ